MLKAARASLETLDSRHPMAQLLGAAVERLARDVDEAEEVRDRVAAVKALMDVTGRLGEVPTTLPPGSPPLDGTDDAEGGAAHGDDPFDIGDLPPGVGNSQAS
ncbi:hypothetical protein [Kineosporia succinea]|uniref:Hsp70 protein n=1 Tax=Kineosporia succinea TaxID=84632 RepID=A0ABT9P5U7_9ACTN|nr:hypothetical protein [Kineosporia succinea]MDP9828055.1 hypothetical protein [Kineosporia succinea]